MVSHIDLIMGKYEILLKKHLINFSNIYVKNSIIKKFFISYYNAIEAN